MAPQEGIVRIHPKGLIGAVTASCIQNLWIKHLFNRLQCEWT